MNATNLKDLLEFLTHDPRANDADWTSLPTFGGPEPCSTVGVWSWDADNLLTGTCARDLRIEPRNGR
jgi:hypothetical protein